MATFAEPEIALKGAEAAYNLFNNSRNILRFDSFRKDELINVGQKQDALQALHDIITSKRYRAWQKTLERIMFKYVELCVDMRRGRFAKDGLISISNCLSTSEC
ncbi:Eukaryotic translation initiation factor 3 subunit A [Ancistrocladus abbreviatus]